jgi:amino acid transporter
LYHQDVSSGKVRGWRIGAVLALALVVGLASASAAFGQAAVDQYIPSADPAGNHGGGSGGAGEAAGGTAAAQGTADLGPGGVGLKKVSNDVEAPAGTASGGNTPGTDYPLTTFIFVVGGIVLLALAARFGPGLVRRFRPGGE